MAKDPVQKLLEQLESMITHEVVIPTGMPIGASGAPDVEARWIGAKRPTPDLISRVATALNILRRESADADALLRAPSKVPLGLPPALEGDWPYILDGDWRIATSSELQPINDRPEVKEVLAVKYDSNGEPSSVGTELLFYAVVRFVDGRWGYVEAWNDYTGWGCQDGVDWRVADDPITLYTHGMTDEGRRALKWRPA